MKKRMVLLAITMCLILLTACGSGGNQLVGSWGISTPADSLIYVLTFDFRADMTGSLYYEFEAIDPTDPGSVAQAVQMQAAWQDERESFSYTVDGDTLTLIYAENDTEAYTFRLSGTQLSLTDVNNDSITLTRL